VSAHVSLESTTYDSSIATARHVAGEGPLPSVRAHMSLDAAASTVADVCGHGKKFMI
jgi:hypothetical protein